MNLVGAIGEGVTRVMEGLDGLFTNDEERLAARNILAGLQTGLSEKAIDLENKLLAAQSSIVLAEAKGSSWLQRNWRPLTMLTFVALVVARWMGWTAPGMSEDEYLSVYALMKIGLGGYVVGRSAEKIVPGVMQAWRSAQGTRANDDPLYPPTPNSPYPTSTPPRPQR